MKETISKENEKECWELFAVPEAIESPYLNEEGTVKLTFHCEKTNTFMNVYYQKDENIDYGTMSSAMKSILSACLHCTGKKPLHDSGYIVH